MFNTLRTRLVLSHVLVLLVIGPLIGLALIYLLETHVLGEREAEDLTAQAQVLALASRGDLNVWHDQTQAAVFVTRVSGPLTAQVTLFDTDGHVLATTGITSAPPDLTPLLSGQATILLATDSRSRAEVADVFVPVVSSDGQVVGVIRLTRQTHHVAGQFNQLRTVVVGVLGGGLLLGALVGWLLAVGLEKRITGLTGAVHRLAADYHTDPVPERGPRELQILARAFNELVERLRMLEDARRRLLANLVHELGRPLGALLSAIQALLGGAIEDTELRSDLLRGMQDEISRLRRLLDDLAQLYDRTVGELELHVRHLDLNEWLPGVLAPWREAAHARGLIWQADLPAALPGLQADPDRLAQVIGNLLSNAIKYTPPGGTVTVAVRPEGNVLSLAVRDTGPGVEPHQRAHIFDPFFRAAAGRRFPQGMGLGLTIAREIATAHGGQLTLEQSSGQGSEFVLKLPLAAP